MARREIVAQSTYGMVRRGAPVTKPITAAKLVQTAPPADMVRLNTGEYVALPEFGQLTHAEQAYLRKFGIDAFNREQTRVVGRHIKAYEQAETYVKEQAGKQQQWYRENIVEVGADKEPILKSAFDELLPDQQKLLKEKGIVEYNRIVAEAYETREARTGEQVFADMVVTGDIPKDAVFGSFNKETREVSYSIPDTRKPSEMFTDLKEAGDIPKDATFESFDKATGEINYTIPTPKEDEGWFRNTVDYLKQALTVDEAILTGEIFGIKNPGLERAAAQINKVFEVFAPRVETKLADDPRGFFVETAKVVASYMPFVWVVNWRGMSKEERIINGAIDAVILATLGLGAGLRNLKAKPIIKAATAAGKAADRMDGTLRILAKTPVDDVAKYVKASSNAQKAIQASKVADNAFIAQLSKIKSLTSSQLRTLERASGVRGLRTAILDVSKAQVQLKVAWKPVSTMKLGGRQYIAQMTKVEAAQANLAKALSNFDIKLKPRYKFTTSPEFKGFAVEWRQKILPTFEGGQPTVVPLRGGKGVQLAVLEKTAPRVSLKNIYQMKLKPVYMEAAEVAKRAIPPAVKAASKVAAATAIAATVARKAATAKAAREAYKRATGKTVTKAITKEAQKQAVKISTKAPTREAVERIIKTATRQAVDIMATGVPAIQAMVTIEINIASMVKALPLASIKVELQTETKIKAMTKIATKLATKILTQVKTKIRLRPRIFLSDGTSRDMTEEELTGSVAWKQGFIYKLIYPPYGEKDIIHSRKPFPGVKTVRGPQSAYKTVSRLGIKLPASIKRDMGIMDIEILTPQKGRGQPKIVFEPDIKQERWHFRGKRVKSRRFINRKRTDRRQRRLQQSVSVVG